MSENSHQSFTELEVWKKGRILKNEIFELTKLFPGEEKFRLSDQIIRSSRGINATIAEGIGRFTYKDQLHFCIMARGSLSETYNHLSNDQLSYYKLKIEEAERLLDGYISYLRKIL